MNYYSSSPFSLAHNASRLWRALVTTHIISLSPPFPPFHGSLTRGGGGGWMLVACCQYRSGDTKIRLVKKKHRLDELCVERFPQFSRNMIQSWIVQGKVLVDGKSASKAGMQVLEACKIDLIAEVPKYVCRAGYKLEAAIEHFGLDVEGKIALDSGLSTGGFTDCLLQHGAALVYGVDVGYGQVAEKIRINSKVCVMERTNLRYLSALPDTVDLVTLDLSFISILLVMPAVCAVMKPESHLITLIKPQFEARRSQVGGGGIVRDPDVHKERLIQLGFPLDILAAVVTLYEKVLACFQTSTVGVKQGCPVSPTLFAIYIDELEMAIRDAGGEGSLVGVVISITD